MLEQVQNTSIRVDNGVNRLKVSKRKEKSYKKDDKVNAQNAIKVLQVKAYAMPNSCDRIIPSDENEAQRDKEM